MNLQAIPITRNPRVLAGLIESNRHVLLCRAPEARLAAHGLRAGAVGADSAFDQPVAAPLGLPGYPGGARTSSDSWARCSSAWASRWWMTPSCAWRMIFWTGWKMAEAIFFCQDTFIRSVFILRIIYGIPSHNAFLSFSPAAVGRGVLAAGQLHAEIRPVHVCAGLERLRRSLVGFSRQPCCPRFSSRPSEAFWPTGPADGGDLGRAIRSGRAVTLYSSRRVGGVVRCWWRCRCWKFPSRRRLRLRPSFRRRAHPVATPWSISSRPSCSL